MKPIIKSITPEIANEMLKKNGMNRMLKEKIVSDYARQMASGLWKEETGETIKIATDGAILDGQHRLAALIKANVTLTFLLITELERDVFSVIDSGKPRSYGDVLHIAGVPNANNMAAGIRRYFNLKTGRVLRGSKFEGVSASEVLSLYSKRPDFWKAAISMAEKWYSHSNSILPMSELLAAYAHFYDIATNDSFIFITSLSDGIGLERNNPIFLLREKLLLAKINTRFALINSVRTALIIKAWNHFRDNNSIKLLKFDPERESFPIAK